MADKIRILYQVNELAFGGTPKSILTHSLYLDPQKYEIFLFCYSDYGSFNYYRRMLKGFFSSSAKKKFEKIYQGNFIRRPEFETALGADHLHFGRWPEFQQLIKKIKPQIIHFWRGEEFDWYTKDLSEISKTSACVETNSFGKPSAPAYINNLKKMFFVSEWLRQKSTWCHSYPSAMVLHPPIFAPRTQASLRQKLSIPEKDLVVGRIGRPGLDSGEAVVKIYRQIRSQPWLLAVGAGSALQTEAKTNPKIICLQHLSEDEVSQFYNSIDVLLHYRSEGETFGMNIAEAMIHGKPTVSHQSYLDNAQAELLLPAGEEPCGFVVTENDFKTHGEKIQELLDDPALRRKMGSASQKRALAHFEAKVLTERLEEAYRQSLAELN